MVPVGRAETEATVRGTAGAASVMLAAAPPKLTTASPPMTNSVARATASAEKIRFMAYSLPARARSSQMQPTSMAA